jgi:nicotinamide-nucleotide amidase
MNGVLNTDLEALAERVAQGLLASGRQLVTAESCTGGWIAKVCTDLPGSSRWFRGGVVAYSNELKRGLLGVRAETLANEGAVSEAVVREMALGALERLEGDVAVAVSGIAGPDGGTPDKPAGTVWLAWAIRERAGTRVRADESRFGGDRERIRRLAVQHALRGVLEMLRLP